MLAASSGKHNVTAWRPSVCPIGILTMASVHFGPTIRRTNTFL